MQNKSKELEVAIKAALEAGKILEKYFETDILKELKEDNSIVTLADRDSEDIIKKIILSAFPSHSILGEETGHTKNGHEYIWHVDPVDGTRNFANGIPLFAVSIALEYKNELFLGVVYNPATNSLFYAEKGKGAYLNNKRIFVSRDDREKGIITFASGIKNEDRKLVLELFHKLAYGVLNSTRKLGCTALDLAYIARGGLEATVQLGFATYDFAAGVLLLQEAGGKITKLDGSQWNFPENYFIASNGVFHGLLVEEVQKQIKKLMLP